MAVRSIALAKSEVAVLVISNRGITILHSLNDNMSAYLILWRLTFNSVQHIDLYRLMYVQIPNAFEYIDTPHERAEAQAIGMSGITAIRRL